MMGALFPSKTFFKYHMDRVIERTNERLAFLSQDKETMRRYEKRRMAIADWNRVTNERKLADPNCKPFPRHFGMNLGGGADFRL
jgi:hypothetical protein